MRICLVCNEYPPAPHGGIGTFTRTLALGLASLHHSVSVIGFRESDRESQESRMDQGIRVTEFLFPSRQDSKLRRVVQSIQSRLSWSRKLRAHVRHHQIDMVESFDWSGPIILHPQCPLVVRMHGANTASRHQEGLPHSPLIKRFESRALRLADAWISVSKSILELTVTALGLPARTAHTIHNGIDTSVFRPTGAARSSNTILFAGTVSHRKGAGMLIQAVPTVLHRFPDARFVFAGNITTDSSGTPLSKQLTDSLPEHLRQNVTFLGRRPLSDLPDLYRSATLCIFPSLAEAFGLTCAEAMACGAPVIMTKLGSGPELVQDGVTGLLADPRDPSCLASAMITLLDNPGLRSSLGTAASVHARNHFSSERMIQASLACYETATSAHSGHRND